MRCFLLVFVACFLLFFLFPYSTLDDQSPYDQTIQTIESTSLPFIENIGQVDEKIAYYSQGVLNGATVLIGHEGEITHKLEDDLIFHERFLDVGNPTMNGLDVTPTKLNYFIGNRGFSGIHSYQSVYIESLYPKIDLELVHIGQTIEKVFHVMNKGNPSDIRIRVEGSTLKRSDQDELVLMGVQKTIHLSAPYAYQIIGGQTIEVNAQYELIDQETYGFKIGSYDKNHALIIDPVYHTTYFGGSGQESPKALLVDDEGFVYVAGDTTSLNLPTENAYQSEHANAGSKDAFVLKFSPDLKTLLEVTYLGGTENDDVIRMEFAPNGRIVLVGQTHSTDFPTTVDSFSTSAFGERDLYVSILSPDLDELIASTYFGGNANDSVRGLFVDEIGIYLSGTTRSSDFPTYLSGHERTFKGNDRDNAFFALLSLDLETHIGGTFINAGSNSHVQAAEIVKDSAGDVFVGGMIKMNADDFETSEGAFVNGTHSNRFFIRKYDTFGENVIASSTFIYSADNYGLATDITLPTMAIGADDVLYMFCQTYFGASPAKHYGHVTKLDNDLSQESGAIVSYATANQYTDYRPSHAKVHPDGYVYVSGRLYDDKSLGTFYTEDPYISRDDRLNNYTRQNVGHFFAAIRPDLDVRNYTVTYPPSTTTYNIHSAFFRSAVFAHNDYHYGLSNPFNFDSEGNVYLAITTENPDLLITSDMNAQIVHMGGTDLYVAKFDKSLGEGVFIDPDDRVHDYESTLQYDGPSDPEGGDTLDLRHVLKNHGFDHGNDATVTITYTPGAVTHAEVFDHGDDEHELIENGIVLYLKDLDLDQRQTAFELKLSSSFEGLFHVTSTVTPVQGSDNNDENDHDERIVDISEKIDYADVFVDVFIREIALDPGTYTHYISFGNHGPDLALDTVLTNILSQDVEFVSAYPETYDLSTRLDGTVEIVWDLFDLDVGTTNHVEGDPDSYYRVVTKLKPDIPRGKLLRDTLVIESAVLDPNHTNEGSQNERTTWYGQIPGLEVEINDAGDLNEAMIHTDESYAYSSMLINTGESEAYDVTFSLEFFDAFDDLHVTVVDQDDTDLTDLADVDETLHLVTIEVPVFGVNDTVKITIEGKIVDWHIDAGFMIPIMAKATGKSNMDSIDEDLQAIDQENIELLRPDIEIIKSITASSGHYVHIEENDYDKEVTVRFTIRNSGPGDSRPFDVVIQKTDPGSCLRVLQGGPDVGDNIFDIRIPDDDTWILTVSDFNDVYGLRGTKADDGITETYIEFTYSTHPDAEYFEHVEIEAELFYLDPNDAWADTDLDNDYGNQPIDFVSLSPRIHAQAFVDPGHDGLIRQEYSLFFGYANTDGKDTPITDFLIQSAFTYYYHDDVFDDHLDVYEGRPLLIYASHPKGVRMDDVLDLYPFARYYVKLDLLAAIDDFDPTAIVENHYAIETMIRFRLNGQQNDLTISMDHAFSLPLQTPIVTYPQTGQLCHVNLPNAIENRSYQVRGYATPFTDVVVYDAATHLEVTRMLATPTGTFQFMIDPNVTRSIYLKLVAGEQSSRPTHTITVTESTHNWCPQESYWEGSGVNGVPYVFKFRDRNTGAPATENWIINGVYGFWDSHLHIKPCCEQPSEIYVNADNVKYTEYTVKDGFYVFNIRYAHSVSIHVDCQESEKPLDSTGSVLIDPDGFVYDSAIGMENVIPGARVTLMVFDAINELWYTWRAIAYDEQINPQIVDDTGYFAFFTPPGTYRLVVENPEPYQKWISPNIIVIDRLVTQNIPYTRMPDDPVTKTVFVSKEGFTDLEHETITIDPGEIIEWISISSTDDLEAEILNPVIRIQSLVDVEKDISGFDSGMLLPNHGFVKMFLHPGTYVYTFIQGDQEKTGTIIVTGTPVDTEVPDMVSNVTHMQVKDTLKLSWDSSVDNVAISHYLVYRKTGSTPFEYLGETDKPEFIDDDLRENETYFYYVIAVDSSENASRRSDLVAFELEPYRSTPVLLIVSIIGLTLVLMTGVTYVFYRKKEQMKS